MKRCDYAIDQLLPHSGPMILLDEVAAYLNSARLVVIEEPGDELLGVLADL